MRSPRVGLLTPYWSFFEASVNEDLRHAQDALRDEAVAQLRGAVEVVADEIAEDAGAGRAAGARMAAAGADAVVVLTSMAVPPVHATAALDVAGLPVVVVAARRGGRLHARFSHADIARDGATVGVPQLTSVLHRRGVAHDLVVWRPGDQRGVELRRAAVAAAAAGRLRAARLVRVGRPIEGYECVDCDDELLTAALGIQVVSVEPRRVADAFRAVPEPTVRATETETRSAWALGPGVDADECLSRSVRMAAALAAFDDELGAAAGAMNCHVPEIRFAAEPGITPCFALGRETSRGIPWTCSGDVLTAVAMLSVKLLGGPALYHEIEALDDSTGEALLANTGEHDRGLIDGEAELVRNRWFDGSDPRCGACARFSVRAGPATLVAFVPHAAEPSGFRFVAAEGAFTGRAFPQTGTPNASFRFASDAPVEKTWAKWAGAGVTHHAAATTGRVGAEVEALARHLSVGYVRVC